MKKSTFKIFSVSKFHAFSILMIVGGFFLSSCEPDDPIKEDVPEMITKVQLTFSADGLSPIVVAATDPDGVGPQPLEIDGKISLAKNTTYTLAISLLNEIADPSSAEYNVTDEVEEEGHEHMFFFSWTNNAFANPAGNGNIDNRNDAVRYNDEDKNSLPLGLSTTWTTSDVASEGVFTVLLKHQPDLKSATSTSSDGETDLDIEFDLEVK